MGYLHGVFLVASVGLVAYVYRSTIMTVARGNSPLSVLLRPAAVLAMGFISGLNVPAIAETFSSLVPPAIGESIWYLVTLLALPALSLFPFLRPTKHDYNKPT